MTRCRRRSRPRCASAAHSAAMGRSKPGFGASYSTPHVRTCAGPPRWSTTTSRSSANGHPEVDAELRVALARLPRAAADGGLPPLLRGPRLRGDRRGARDQRRNRRRDPQRSARGASHPTGGGTEHDRPRPRQPRSRSSRDVRLGRLGRRDRAVLVRTTRRRRRRLVAFAAAALVAVVGTASAFGSVRDFFLDRGFIGLPPAGSDAEYSGERKAPRIFYWGPAARGSWRRAGSGCTPTGG